MTDIQKIAVVDELLKTARDQDIRKASRVGGGDGHRFRVAESLVEDKGEWYWLAIEYVDR